MAVLRGVGLLRHDGPRRRLRVPEAWASLAPEERPRGFMFWNLQLDGGHPNGGNQSCSMAKGFNEFLHVRK